MNGQQGSTNNKLNLSFNNPLKYDFTQMGVSLTYSLSPSTVLTAAYARSRSKWVQGRENPRANVNAPYNASDYTAYYSPPNSYGYWDWLRKYYKWSDTNGDRTADTPTSLADAMDPSRVVLNSPYGWPNYAPVIPSQGTYITKTFQWPGDTVKAVVVSPHGFNTFGYYDMSHTYDLAGAEYAVFNTNAIQNSLKADITHVLGSHTLRSGLEIITASLEYHGE